MRRIPSELWFALFILGWSYYLRGLFLSMQFSEPPPPAIRVAAGIKVSSTGTTYEKLYDEASKLHYVLFKPPKFATQPGLVWPLLVFLHGAGEQGEDLDLLFSEGATGCPPAELAAGRANCVLKDHFVVLAPQTSQGWHYDVDKLGPLVDRLVADPSLGLSADHLYVTGVANGGFGAWALGATTLPGSKRHRFAAVAPVSSSKAIDIEHLGRVPVWAFHSANDGRPSIYLPTYLSTYPSLPHFQ